VSAASSSASSTVPRALAPPPGPVSLSGAPGSAGSLAPAPGPASSSKASGAAGSLAPAAAPEGFQVRQDTTTFPGPSRDASAVVGGRRPPPPPPVRLRGGGGPAPPPPPVPAGPALRWEPAGTRTRRTSAARWHGTRPSPAATCRRDGAAHTRSCRHRGRAVSAGPPGHPRPAPPGSGRPRRPRLLRARTLCSSPHRPGPPRSFRTVRLQPAAGPSSTSPPATRWPQVRSRPART
jgi:hypothetical protein